MKKERFPISGEIVQQGSLGTSRHSLVKDLNSKQRQVILERELIASIVIHKKSTVENTCTSKVFPQAA